MSDTRKIIIVSTEVAVGKGGISTALTGVTQSLQASEFKLVTIASHSSTRGKLFYKALHKLIRTCKRGDIVWLHCGQWFSVLRKTLLGTFARLLGGKVVIHFHSQTLIAESQSVWRRAIIRWAVATADGVVVLTPWWLNFMNEHFPQASGKLIVIPNAIDKSLSDIASNHHATGPKAHCKLLCLTRLVAGKGVERVIETLAILPDNFSLTIAGDGELMPQLQSLVKTMNLQSRVTFSGWISGEEKHQAFANHDIFFLPTKYDSFGMGFIEAMSYGLPVVALDYQAISDVIPDNVAGVLCDEDSPDAYAKAIIDCVGNWQTYSSAGQQHVLHSFSASRISDRVIKEFEGL